MQESTKLIRIARLKEIDHARIRKVNYVRILCNYVEQFVAKIMQKNLLY